MRLARQASTNKVIAPIGPGHSLMMRSFLASEVQTAPENGIITGSQLFPGFSSGFVPMPRLRRGCDHPHERSSMATLWIIIATVFVLAVLGVVVYAIIAPFGHHSEQFRDPRTGRRLGESPHLETRDEFEHRTAAY